MATVPPYHTSVNVNTSNRTPGRHNCSVNDRLPVLEAEFDIAQSLSDFKFHGLVILNKRVFSKSFPQIVIFDQLWSSITIYFTYRESENIKIDF